MAETGTASVSYIEKGVVSAQWDFTASGTGNAIDTANFSERNVQITIGTSGTSTLIVEGSNSPTSGYVGLSGPTGAAMSYTAAANLDNITVGPRYIRPRAATVTAGNTVEVVMVMRSGRR
jgi:hypothetical protein